MLLLNKLKKKLLERSNSYNYYKDGFIKLSNNQKNFLVKIDNLESDLSNKNNEISSLYKEISILLNKNDSLNYDEIISKLYELSQDNIKINEKLELINQTNDLNQNNFIELDNKLNFLEFQLKEYEECRKYFFNGCEEILKEYMDTDFLFNVCYFNEIEFLSFSQEENRILLKTKNDIILSTNNHIWTIMEVYGLNEYSIPQLYLFDDFVVFDIGMNRAYATLNFAKYKNCSCVYGFEIDKNTYDIALDNINLNPDIKNKIIPFNLGLSDCDDIVDLYYIEGYDGLNTIIPEFTNVQPSLKYNEGTLKTKTVEVKKTSPILKDLINKLDSNSKIVLKIDTEGAEYKIIGDLMNSGLISKIDVILGEGHIFSDDDFREDLINLGFKVVKMDQARFSYSFAMVKEEYYKFWPLI